MIAPDGWYCRPFSVSAERSTISARAGGRCSPAHHSRQWATVRSREFVRSDGPGRLRVSEKPWTSPSDDRPPLAGALHAVGDDRVAVGELADEPAEPALPGDGAVLAVVGAWVADDLDLDGAADALEAAAHRLARADVQPVGQADGAGRRGERRLDDVGLRQVAALDGDVADRPDAPGAAALRVQQRGEDRRAVEARPAEPVDRPVGRDECRRSAVGEEGVVADRGVAGGVARGSQIAWNRGRERRAKHTHGCSAQAT